MPPTASSRQASNSGQTSSLRQTSPTRRPDPAGRPTDGLADRPPAAEGRTRSHPGAARLNREWEQLRHTTADWLTPAPTAEMVLQSIRFNPDQVLGELIAACQQGHQLAGRVVVQALLPKLVNLARTWPYPEVDHLVSGLWVRLANYPLARRPASIAANLVLDTRKDIVGEARATPVLLASPVGPDLRARSVIEVAGRLGLAGWQSLSILEMVYVDELPRQQVADRHAMSVEAVRRRCCDTVRTLRAHRVLLADLADAA